MALWQISEALVFSKNTKTTENTNQKRFRSFKMSDDEMLFQIKHQIVCFYFETSEVKAVSYVFLLDI